MEEAFSPGACVAHVARRHDISTALIYTWRKKFSQPEPGFNKAMRLDARAEQLGVSPISLAYDLMLEDEGSALLFLPGSNFDAGNLDDVREMMAHPQTIIGLGDGNWIR